MHRPTRRASKVTRQLTFLLLFFLYVSPALVAAGGFIAYNHGRLSEVTRQLLVDAREFQGTPPAGEQKAEQGWLLFLAQQWQEAGGDKARFVDGVQRLLEQELQRERLWMNATVILLFTLLPFGLMGLGFAARHDDEEPLSVGASRALQHWGIKLLVAVLIAFGSVYFFNPFGQGASSVYSFLKYRDLFSKDSLPIYLESSAPARRVLIGFLGWYLHLLGYFSYRLSRGDVTSTRVYGLVFQHLLFVLGLAVSLPLENDSKWLFIIFLVGHLPLSGLGLLKQVLLGQLSKDDEEDLSLLQLPSISRFDALRLQEEGIDNIPALLSMEAATLRRLVPISPGMIDLWRGAASLISAIGMARYKELRNHCLTGEEFARRIREEPSFREVLVQQCKINNPDEVATLVSALIQGQPLALGATAQGDVRSLSIPAAPAAAQEPRAALAAAQGEHGG